jgi:hypothetical protein
MKIKIGDVLADQHPARRGRQFIVVRQSSIDRDHFIVFSNRNRSSLIRSDRLNNPIRYEKVQNHTFKEILHYGTTRNSRST